MIEMALVPFGLGFSHGTDLPGSVIQGGIVHIENQDSVTPSPYDHVKLATIINSTGTLYIEEDPEYIIEKAFGFMENISKALPYSERADREALALANRIRGDIQPSPI